MTIRTAARLLHRFTSLHGPVCSYAHKKCRVGLHLTTTGASSCCRNPFFPKYFLSLGDWTCRIWNEDLRTPLLVSRYSNSYLTAGTWSPTRPGVFFTSQSDGCLSCWDLFYKHNEPSLQVRTKLDGQDLGEGWGGDWGHSLSL